MPDPCRCALCCEVLLVQASAADALREPRIAALGAPVHRQRPGDEDELMDAGEVTGYVLNRGGAAGGACLFLSRDEAGRGVCGIYTTRPDVCRGFDCAGAGGLQLIGLGYRPG